MILSVRQFRGSWIEEKKIQHEEQKTQKGGEKRSKK